MNHFFESSKAVRHILDLEMAVELNQADRHIVLEIGEAGLIISVISLLKEAAQRSKFAGNRQNGKSPLLNMVH